MAGWFCLYPPGLLCFNRTILSDCPELKAIRRYGILHASPIMARRAFFFIDKQGVVRGWADDSVSFASEPFLQVAREIAGKP
jgi:hypothetical protein